MKNRIFLLALLMLAAWIPLCIEGIQFTLFYVDSNGKLAEHKLADMTARDAPGFFYFKAKRCQPFVGVGALLLYFTDKNGNDILLAQDQMITPIQDICGQGETIELYAVTEVESAIFSSMLEVVKSPDQLSSSFAQEVENFWRHSLTRKKITSYFDQQSVVQFKRQWAQFASKLHNCSSGLDSDLSFATFFKRRWNRLNPMPNEPYFGDRPTAHISDGLIGKVNAYKMPLAIIAATTVVVAGMVYLVYRNYNHAQHSQEENDEKGISNK